jgi:hypothetical protein
MIEKLEEKKVISFDDTPEDQMAKQALHEAFTLALGPSPQQIKLAATRIVLEWTKAKPATKADLTIQTAEKWLEQVAKDNEPDSGA